MAALGTAICNFVGMQGTTFIIARECVAYRAMEIRRTKSSNYVEMRGTAASNCMECVELRPKNAWKCAEARLAWECKLRGRLRTEAGVRGKRMGSAREVRLKWVEPRFHALVGPLFILDRHFQG